MALRARLSNMFRLTSRLIPALPHPPAPLRTTFSASRTITTSAPQSKSIEDGPEVPDLLKDTPAPAPAPTSATKPPPIDIQSLLRNPASVADSAAKKPSPNFDSIFHDIPTDGERAQRSPSIVLDIINERSNFHSPAAASAKPSMAPYLGRSVATFNNVNAAYWRLNSILRQNNVRKELKMKLRYEKPTARRRREAIESNRKIFGKMVKKKVGLIMQMKHRGL